MTAKSEIFGKSSLGKKKPPTVNDFRIIKELGSGKYGQVSLVQYFFYNLGRSTQALSVL